MVNWRTSGIVRLEIKRYVIDGEWRVVLAEVSI